MDPRFNSAISSYGAEAKAKLANPVAKGEPEEQLRALLERLIVDLAEFCGFPRSAVTAAADLGRTIIWLHTFGERFADPKRGRPAGPPRLPKEVAPRIPAGGAISQGPAEMPDSIDYDEAKHWLLIGHGYVEGVPPQVWNYEVSGKQVLRQWFSYRKANRELPIIGDRKPPSKLGDIQLDHWPAEDTTELINVLNVLGRLVELEQVQAELLEQICSGQTISAEELRNAGALRMSATQSLKTVKSNSPGQLGLLD